MNPSCQPRGDLPRAIEPLVAIAVSAYLFLHFKEEGASMTGIGRHACKSIKLSVIQCSTPLDIAVKYNAPSLLFHY